MHNKYPFLASSPDRLLRNYLSEDHLVEIKCPYSIRNGDINSKLEYLKEQNGELCLDNAHYYYFQVQGQLACSGMNSCIFVIYTYKDLKYFMIQRDETFIDSMIENLISFYEKYFKPALLNKYLYRI